MAYDKDNKKPVRCSRYQYNLIEIPVSDIIMNSFVNSQGTHKLLNPFNYDERILDLKDKLIEIIWIKAKQILTVGQFKVLDMYFRDGYTQQEIAKILCCNQTSISNRLMGGKVYVNKKLYKTYGGIFRKLNKAFLKDQEIIAILEEINELKIYEYE